MTVDFHQIQAAQRVVAIGGRGSVSSDEHGRLVVDDTPGELVGRWFRRTEPQGDAADVLRVVGVDLDVDVTGESRRAVLCVQSIEFGAVMPGTDSYTARLEFDELEESYRRTTVELEAAEQRLASIAAEREAEEARLEADAQRAAEFAKRVERNKLKNGGI